MKPSEPKQRTADQNLQLLIDRYSLVGSNDTFYVEDMTNTDNADEKGQRAEHVYGILTKGGLVHVIADVEKSDSCIVETLIINHSFVTHSLYTYNRRYRAGHSNNHTVEHSSIPIENQHDTIALVTYHREIEGKDDDEIEQIVLRRSRTTRALARFASISNIHDALHQTRAFRYPADSNNPYAEHVYGPRINLQEMHDAGIVSTPAITEALAHAPKFVIDDSL